MTGKAVNVTLLPVHTAPAGFAVMVTDGTSLAFTLSVIILEVAVLLLAHSAVEVIITSILSVSFNVVVLNVLPEPALFPFTSHWKDGLPPFTGAAVKVTLVPEHTGPVGFSEIVTEGVTDGVTVMVTVLDVSVAGDAQVALEVITSFT